MYGGAGNDGLYGEAGDDTLIGGVGNDTLQGGVGNDTYIFNLGDGKDTIFDYEAGEGGKADKIVFGEGIGAEDLKIRRNGANLIIDYSETDSITVQNAYLYSQSYVGTYTDGRAFVEKIEFADGMVLEAEDILGIVNSGINGTEENDNIYGYDSGFGYDTGEKIHGYGGNDYLYGRTGDDTLYGDEGNDSLSGEDGDDTLIGGVGNDTLQGGVGNDTYIFNLGDGRDTISDYEAGEGGKADKIVFGEGISAEDIGLAKNGNNFVINYSENDSVTIQNAYRSGYQDGQYYVENVEFSNGDLYKINYSDTTIEFISGNESDLNSEDAQMLSLFNVDSLVDEIENTNLDEEGIMESVAGSDESGDEVAAIVNLVVQDMSESSLGNVGELIENTDLASTEEAVGLWISE